MTISQAKTKRMKDSLIEEVKKYQLNLNYDSIKIYSPSLSSIFANFPEDFDFGIYKVKIGTTLIGELVFSDKSNTIPSTCRELIKLLQKNTSNSKDNRILQEALDEMAKPTEKAAKLG